MRLLKWFCVAAVVSFSVFSLGISRFLERVFELFKPEPLRLAADGFALVGSIDGQALDPALANSLRFEAGQSRRAAPRNT